MNLNTWTTLQQTCTSSQPRVQFFRSLANITDLYVTCYKSDILVAPDAGEDDDQGLNAALTTYFRN